MQKRRQMCTIPALNSKRCNNPLTVGRGNMGRENACSPSYISHIQ
jgi:hypothetical protein